MQNSNKMILLNYNKALKKMKVYFILITLIIYNKTSLKDCDYYLSTRIILSHPAKAMYLFVNTQIISILQICNKVVIHFLISAYTRH